MQSIDIRNQDNEEVTEIVFADKCNMNGCYQAHKIIAVGIGKYFTITDSTAAVIINSKEHAQNLIKAINKAIELGWVK